MANEKVEIFHGLVGDYANAGCGPELGQLLTESGGIRFDMGNEQKMRWNKGEVDSVDLLHYKRWLMEEVPMLYVTSTEAHCTCVGE